MRKAQTEINNPAIRNPNSTLPKAWRWGDVGGGVGRAIEK